MARQLFKAFKRLVCGSVVFWYRSSIGTAEEEWGFGSALSALSNEQGKSPHLRAP